MLEALKRKQWGRKMEGSTVGDGMNRTLMMTYIIFGQSECSTAPAGPGSSQAVAARGW